MTIDAIHKRPDESALHGEASESARDADQWAPPQSLKTRAIRSSIWIVLGHGANQGIRLAGNLVLTRLLFPEAFGLMALVSVFMQGLGMFTDIGLGPSIIQNKRGDDPNFLNTAWTIQIVRGGFLWVCSCLIAVPAARFFNQPMLAYLIPVAGFASVFGGFMSTKVFTANRHLQLGRLTALNLGCFVISLIVMIICAWTFRSVWALVAGGLVGGALKVILSHVVLAGHRNSFHWDKPAAGALFHFGKWIFITTALTLVATQIDRLILGRMITLDLLGLYSIAMTFAFLPRNLLSAFGSNLVFPAASRQLADRPDKLRESLLHHRWKLAVVAGIPLALMVCFGDWVFTFLYDERFARAAWMIPLLAMGLWPRILFITVGPCLKALGKPQYDAIGSAIRMVLVAPLLIALVNRIGILGAVVVMALSEIPHYLVITVGLLRNKLLLLRQDLVLTLGFFVLVALAMTVRSMLSLNVGYSPLPLIP